MLEALAQQKVLPGLRRLDSELYARWLPLLDGHRIDRLAGAMPPVCRAAAQQVLSPRDLLESFLEETTDALVREWGSEPGPLQNPSEPGSRWLAALFGEQDPISASAAQLESLERSHNIWLRNLKLAGDEHFRVAFQFMRECAPLLEEGGFGVLIPPWWNRSGARLHLRARISPARSSSASEVRRSGKLERLLELLDEVLSVGDRCLIFTQYQEMGAMLHRAFSERFDTATQFIHGGTPARKRTEMVRRFQEDEEGRPSSSFP